MSAQLQAKPDESAVARGAGASAFVPGLLAIALLFVLFRDTAAAMVSIWLGSETFKHAFLVAPISLWLVWGRRAELAGLTPRSEPAWLLPMAAVCLAWLLGDLAGVNAATQFAFVTLIVLSVPAVFGWPVAKVLAFPLLFLYFAVPFGDFLLEPMMEATADFTVAALKATGIPVYREGLQFVIPSGSWSVVEACSGVRYLIASFMVGTLFAYLNYRSTRRRLAFMAVSIAVPIVANWLRAYMIVMLGHLTDNKLAAGADHLIYGWVFFGVVIMIMFVIGARFADAPPAAQVPAAAPAPVPAPGHGVALAAAARPGPAPWVVPLAVAGLLAATQAAMWKLSAPSSSPLAPLELPATLPGGWQRVQPPRIDWSPAYGGASAVASAAYRQGDAEVGVWIGYYRDQTYGRKLVTSTNMLVADASTAWRVTARQAHAVALAGEALPMQAATLRSPADTATAARERMRVAYVYRVAGRFTARDAEAKIRPAVERLLGRGDGSAVIMLFAPLEAGERSPQLDRFAAEQLPELGRRIDAMNSPPR